MTALRLTSWSKSGRDTYLSGQSRAVPLPGRQRVRRSRHRLAGRNASVAAIAGSSSQAGAGEVKGRVRRDDPLLHCPASSIRAGSRSRSRTQPARRRVPATRRAAQEASGSGPWSPPFQFHWTSTLPRTSRGQPESRSRSCIALVGEPLAADRRRGNRSQTHLASTAISAVSGAIAAPEWDCQSRTPTPSYKRLVCLRTKSASQSGSPPATSNKERPQLEHHLSGACRTIAAVIRVKVSDGAAMAPRDQLLMCCLTPFGRPGSRKQRRTAQSVIELGASAHDFPERGASGGLRGAVGVPAAQIRP